MTGAYRLSTDPDAGPVARFAADELVRYLRGIATPSDSNDATPIYLGTNPGGHSAGEQIGGRLSQLPEDSFALVTVDDALFIAGRNDRGVLYGVYAFLESLGARWFFPGPAGEVWPTAPFRTTGFDRWEIPDFPGRGITYYPYRYDDPVRWVDFAAKQRLNLIFMHVDVEPWEELGPTLQWWEDHAPAVVPEIERRGLRWELGGHLLRGKLLRPEVFDTHPEYFREVRGQRVPDFNLCTANRDGVRYVQEQLLEWVARWPGASVQHLWPNDIDGGGWCECVRCRDLSPSDQSLRLANHLAEALRDAGSAQRAGYLAYHDTLNPPAATTPDPDLVLHWAPRERCYACPLDSPSCALNRAHLRALEGTLARFAPDNVEIYEYYLDGILYHHLQPPLLDLVARDLRAYHRLGVRTITPLLVALVPYSSPPLPLFVYPRLFWNVAASPDEIVRDYAAVHLGDARLADAFVHVDDALSELLRMCDSPNALLTYVEGGRSPSLDTLDAHIRRLEHAERQLAMAQAVLAAGEPGGPHQAGIEAERRTLDYQLRTVHALVDVARAVAAAERDKRAPSESHRQLSTRSLQTAMETLDGREGDALTVVLNWVLTPPVHNPDGRQHRPASDVVGAHATKLIRA